MKKLILAVLLSFTAISIYAADEWNEKSVASVVEQIKSGSKFYENRYNSNEQIAQINTDRMRYIIDVKARLCFARPFSDGGWLLVPCKALKDGYPIMAPIISWEK